MLSGFEAQWLILSCIAIVVFVLYKFLVARNKSSLPLLPGPRPLPLLGNVLQFPTQNLGRGFRELSDKYGDVVHLRILGRSIILIGSYEAACDILEKRSANNSDRPPSAMVEMTDLDWVFVFKSYGPEWRKYRRVMHNAFTPDAITRYWPVQLQTTRELLRNLLTSPTNFSAHIHFSFAATVLRVVYGLDITPGDDEYYQLIERLGSITADIATPGQHSVEAFPSMRYLPSWLPGMGFKKQAAAWKLECAHVRDSLYKYARETMVRTGVKESILTMMTEKYAEEDLIKNMTATIYSSSADTTNAAAHALILALAMHPEVQRKAQAELDNVIGPDRLPEFSDRDALPYVRAIVKEVVRWHAVAPVGGAHRSTVDDEYNGYFIPAQSIIIPNQWAMSRDPAHYPNPDAFNPDRFFLNGELNPNVRDPATFAFGFGRRICPGRHFAEATLFIMCASILHTMDIGPALDENGVPKKLEMKTDGLAVEHPKPFECRFTARNARMKDLVFASEA
ncbi:cytochrome P450 [Cubamyces lactineus]|nr:cytochrome P450 [Cubamyces lactineus]